MTGDARGRHTFSSKLLTPAKVKNSLRIFMIGIILISILFAQWNVFSRSVCAFASSNFYNIDIVWRCVQIPKCCYWRQWQYQHHRQQSTVIRQDGDVNSKKKNTHNAYTRTHILYEMNKKDNDQESVNGQMYVDSQTSVEKHRLNDSPFHIELVLFFTFISISIYLLIWPPKMNCFLNFFVKTH